MLRWSRFNISTKKFEDSVISVATYKISIYCFLRNALLYISNQKYYRTKNVLRTLRKITVNTNSTKIHASDLLHHKDRLLITRVTKRAS